MEKIAEIFSQAIPLLILIFLIVYVQKKRQNNFVKGLLIISLIIISIQKLIFLIVYRSLSENLTEYILTKLEHFSVFVNTFGYLSYSLLFLGLSFLFGENQHENKEEIKLTGKKRSIWISFLLLNITGGLYFPFWLHRTVKDLETNFISDVPYSPGKAVGYLFIPIFNIFWFVYIIFSLPRVISNIEKKYFTPRPGFHLKPVLISVLILLIPITATLEYVNKIESDFVVPMVSIFCYYLIQNTLFLALQAKINGFYEHNPNFD